VHAARAVAGGHGGLDQGHALRDRLGQRVHGVEHGEAQARAAIGHGRADVEGARAAAPLRLRHVHLAGPDAVHGRYVRRQVGQVQRHAAAVEEAHRAALDHGEAQVAVDLLGPDELLGLGQHLQGRLAFERHEARGDAALVIDEQGFHVGLRINGSQQYQSATVVMQTVITSYSIHD
jgi:hypothetical protein